MDAACSAAGGDPDGQTIGRSHERDAGVIGRRIGSALQARKLAVQRLDLLDVDCGVGARASGILDLVRITRASAARGEGLRAEAPDAHSRSLSSASSRPCP